MSNITKNVESLERYNNFKVFLDGLPSAHASKEEREEMERIQKIKKERLERNRLQEQANRSTNASRGGGPNKSA